MDVAVGAVENPLQAVDPAPSDPPCSSPYTSKGKEPNCEYTFELASCSATWTCDDGQVVSFSLAYDVDYGTDLTCATETHCVFDSASNQMHDRAPGEMDVCEPTTIACPVGTEADVRAYCAPLPIEPAPVDCPPQDSASSSP
ncbi:MAG TPA: hypothetical protein VG963_01165 [Polyangiaceae bacterium]|nr:hypothetical protein [Polyangiaceae bacterium]